jgi:ketol-acid reductoisomerase
MPPSAWQYITLIGFGSQGQAWAQNLRDSGREVRCYLRENSNSIELANSLGFESSCDLGQLLPKGKSNQVILLLIPDHAHKNFLEDHKNDIPPGTSLIYGHGASVVEHQLIASYPQWNHILLAPKAIASELRSGFVNGHGLGAVYSLEGVENQSIQKLEGELLELAKNIGITAGPYKVTFEQETRADLLSEQSLLCGLLPYAARNCFDTMLENDIPPELAYLEAWHEVKLIANAMIQLGPTDFFKLISPHALIGARLASKELFDKGHQETIERLRQDIWSGNFFKKASSLSPEKERELQIEAWKNSDLQKTFEKLRSGLAPQSE